MPQCLVGADGIPGTRVARWLVALLEEFGGVELARWGRARTVRVSPGAAMVYVNSRVRGAKPDAPARPAFVEARAVFCALRHPGERFWSLHATEGPRLRRRPGPGAFLGMAADLEEAEVLALWASPPVPPPGSGWTLEEWASRD